MLWRAYDCGLNGVANAVLITSTGVHGRSHAKSKAHVGEVAVAARKKFASVATASTGRHLFGQVGRSRSYHQPQDGTSHPKSAPSTSSQKSV
mmetsp:Transcript_2938/g.5806  ORF Transcript_2938/g.5806 Transcript_2938/m.5806 type:complete len:92 (+) Transcript_2938:1191-1466(+)